MAKDLNMCVLLDIYGALISEKQLEIMDYYYNQDYSLAEISEHLGITRQGVRDSIKRAEQVITESEEKLGLIKKYEENSRRIDKLNKIISGITRMDFEKTNRELLLKELEKLSEGIKTLQL